MQTIKLLISLCVLFATQNVSGVNEKKVDAKVEKAIVFLQGAQLFSTANFSVGVGNTDLVFEGVSPFIDPLTLQASGTGSIIIMDVRHNMKYPDAIPFNDKVKPKNLKLIKATEDSLVEINWQLDELEERRAALTIEKNTLLNNKVIKGDTKRDSLPLLKDALEYLRLRLANINSEFAKIKREEFRANRAKDRMTLSLKDMYDENQLLGQVNPTQKIGAINQVIVTVSSLFATSTNISINYFVASAGWTPNYDLRASSANANLKLDQKANVYQNSGVDWSDVYLTLSTSTPGQGNSKPNLAANYLAYYVPRSYSYKRTPMPSMRAESLSEKDNAAPSEDAKAAATAADYTVTVENPIRVDYEIKLRYNIPSDSKTHMVMVQSKEVPSTFVYSGIPKLDANAFLLAKVTDWENLNLIPGSARIFFDGAYVGETSIDPSNTEDTLLLSMGRDKGLVMERKKLKDKSKDNTFNNDRVITHTYELTIRNTKSSTIRIEIEDQIPVSQIEEIKVALIESSNAVLDETTGKLKWNLNLKSKEVRKISFSYEVKYPKNKQVAGL